MLRKSLHFLAGNDRLRRTASSNPAARKLASRFVAGETLDEAVAAVRTVNVDGLTASLDHLGENVITADEAREGASAYNDTLGAIADNGLQANISCKLTHLGLDLGLDGARERVVSVVSHAAERDIFVRIDMEGSMYTQVTLDLAKEIYSDYPNSGTVIQSYLFRSQGDVRDLNLRGIRVRLVKGAYLEPPNIAYPNKHDVDANYQRLSDSLLQDGQYPAFATHDEALVEWIRDRARTLGRESATFEFQMLYGIRRDLQRRLKTEGHNVRVYIPFGSQWYPYLMRRLAERPANLVFMVGNVAREARSR
jgi:proline dehydrogenase